MIFHSKMNSEVNKNKLIQKKNSKRENNFIGKKVDLKNDIENLIKTDTFNNTLLYNFKETLKEYLFFSDNNKYQNLNNIII